MADALAAAAADAALFLLGSRPDYLETLKGGRNSRVYRVQVGGVPYALKQYFRHPGDSRDRMGTEFSALTFMRSGGIASVPKPLGCHESLQCAVYEFVAGAGIGRDTVIDDDIDSAVRFLVELRHVSQSEAVMWALPASEARFSIAQILENIGQRVAALTKAPRTGHSGEGLDTFLMYLQPALAQIGSWARDESNGFPDGFTLPIPQRERTLSPSDFGFHNALRRPNGELTFLDFEYFGWDDPGKAICDFLIHPAMDLTAAQKQRFTRTVLDAMADVPRLAERVRVLYPLFGLKWVAILLNEFLPEHLLRRDFAAAALDNHEQLRLRQLEKARTLLDHVLASYWQFPYA